MSQCLARRGLINWLWAWYLRGNYSNGDQALDLEAENPLRNRMEAVVGQSGTCIVFRSIRFFCLACTVQCTVGPASGRSQASTAEDEDTARPHVTFEGGDTTILYALLCITASFCMCYTDP
jgi:hypothetical protein